LRPIGKRGCSIRDELVAVRPLVLARDGHLCARCRDPLCKPLDLHHRRARSQGGTHSLDNLVTLGRACHDLVTEHLAPDWRKWISARNGPVSA
jgi:5-methylcytosine-specific restriction endonuclease McrA